MGDVMLRPVQQPGMMHHVTLLKQKIRIIMPYCSQAGQTNASAGHAGLTNVQ